MAKRKPETGATDGALKVPCKQGEDRGKAIARAMSLPETQAALTIRQWQDTALPESIDINATIDELKEQTKALKANDMSRAESMLLAQAQTLDELFNILARKAHRCEYLNQFETNLKLALKAQNQCSMTLETLSNIKNPPVVYAKQANISNGPQQINNGVSASRTPENQKQQNELLTVSHGETLDGGRTGETIGGNQAMATLE